MPMPPVPVELPGILICCCGRLLNEDDPAVIEPPALGAIDGVICREALGFNMLFIKEYSC
jgi:hypothetical protein